MFNTVKIGVTGEGSFKTANPNREKLQKRKKEKNSGVSACF